MTYARGMYINQPICNQLYGKITVLIKWPTQIIISIIKLNNRYILYWLFIRLSRIFWWTFSILKLYESVWCRMLEVCTYVVLNQPIYNKLYVKSQYYSNDQHILLVFQSLTKRKLKFSSLTNCPRPKQGINMRARQCGTFIPRLVVTPRHFFFFPFVKFFLASSKDEIGTVPILKTWKSRYRYRIYRYGTSTFR